MSSRPYPFVSAALCFLSLFASGASAGEYPELTKVIAHFETNLLPLEVRHYSIRTQVPVFVGGGAITSVGEEVIIMDHRGAFFTFAAGLPQPSPLPGLPMNSPAFERSAPGDSLIAKDIKYDETSGKLFATYEAYDATSKTQHMEIASLAVGKSLGASPQNWEVIFKSPPLHGSHESSVGKIAFDEKNLYFSIGKYDAEEGNADPAPQNRNEFLGKTYALDRQTKQLTTLSIGNRVALGILVSAKGDLWLTENAERGGDKLARIEPDQNYGWPFSTNGTKYYTYSARYGRPRVPATGNNAPFTEPVYAWSPSIAPSAIIESRGFDPAWEGDFLMGSLKAQTLYRIRLRDNHVVMVEPLWIGHRIRDIISLADQIVIWTDEASLIFLRVNQERLRSNWSVDTDVFAGSLRACVSCHSFHRDQPNAFAPSLDDVYGRKIGGDAFAYTSDALKKKDGVWDDASLAAFLTEPDGFAPGTTMRLGDRLNPEQIVEIIALLKERSNKAEASPKP